MHRLFPPPPPNTGFLALGDAFLRSPSPLFAIRPDASLPDGFDLVVVTNEKISGQDLCSWVRGQYPGVEQERIRVLLIVADESPPPGDLASAVCDVVASIVTIRASVVVSS
jgi:hypothetical protein